MLSRRGGQRKVTLQIERLEVAVLEITEHFGAPGDGALRVERGLPEQGRVISELQFGLFVGAGVAAAAVAENVGGQDADALLGRVLPGAVIPPVLKSNGHSLPASQGGLEALVGMPGVRPAKHLEEVKAGEGHQGLGKAVAAGKVQEGQQDGFVLDGRKPVRGRAGDGDFEGDGLAGFGIYVFVLVGNFIHSFGRAFGENGKGEKSPVHFVTAVTGVKRRKGILKMW